MTGHLENKKLISFKELLIANSMQVDVLAWLLREKRLMTEQELFAKLRQVQLHYHSNPSSEH